MRALARALGRLGNRSRSVGAKIRYRLAALSFARAGRGGQVGARVRIAPELTVNAGDRLILRDDVFLAGRGVLTVGDRTVINQGCIVTAMESVTIGSNVMFAANCYVLDVDHRFDRRDVPIPAQGYLTGPVVIGDGAWLGAGVVVTRGVTIGAGAIIGANSVVTSDIPDFAIAAGIPARVIRERPL